MDCRWRHLRGTTLLRNFLANISLAEGAPATFGLAELAGKLGVKSGTVYAWSIGYRRPSEDYREALVRIAGIPADAWRTARERHRAEKLRAA